MRKPKSSKVLTTTVKKEIIEIDSDTDTDEEVGGRMLALCGEVNASSSLELHNTLAIKGETSKTGLEIVCADDCDSGLEYDLEYKKYLASCTEINLYLPQRDTSPMRLMYTDRSKVRAVKSEKRISQSPLISRSSKRLKIENGKADHTRKTGQTKNTIKLEPTSTFKDRKHKKEDSRTTRKVAVTKNTTIKLEPTSTVKDSKHKKEDSRTTRKVAVTKNTTIKLEPTSTVKDSKHKKEDSRTTRKVAVTKNTTIKLEPTSNVKHTKQKKGDSLPGRKILLTKKNSFKACKKENEQRSARRNAKSETVLRASKRLKTENGISRSITLVETKERKKGERKIHVSKSNVISKSTKDNLGDSLKPRKKESEESLSALDKGYAYFLKYLRNSITVVSEPNRKVKPVEDSGCLYDPDIIAVSDYPFFDGGKSPFEANKDGKVIDLEDGIEPDNIFNSSFTKKLMEVLREPYDKKEFVKLYHQASHKRPLTRYRQLRNGNEIEYNVHNQLTHSYLQDYPDFKKQLSRCRKDPPRALNLLRGFLFYLENIILEGAFKPWKYEQRLTRECKILYASSSSARHSS